MNAWSRKGRRGYAEWFPQVDLDASRWVEESPSPSPVQLVARDRRREDEELGESA